MNKKEMQKAMLEFRKKMDTHGTLKQELKKNKGEDFYFMVDRDSKEWVYMWDALAKHEMNKKMKGEVGSEKDPTVAFNEGNGETWQYMDTSLRGKIVGHCFRHRSHPDFDNERVGIIIPASEGFEEEYNSKAIKQ